MRQSWQVIAASKRAERDTKVKTYLGLDIDESILQEITAIDDAATLVRRISDGSLTAETVCSAYIKMACRAQTKTNCLTEIRFEEALKEARQLDDYQKTHGKLLGPLHGVPMSAKDQFDIRGLDTTLGYCARADQPATEDGQLVKTLKSLGAVIIAKTNLPQSIMWCETENPLWGLTTNPKNSDFTPGGSSGGEAALLASHGSLVGWGTDIGGSVRIPSHMNGLWGFKPTSKRLSYSGVPVSTEGQEHVPSAIGPMTRSLTALVDVFKAVIETEPWRTDPSLPPIPWNNDAFSVVRKRPIIFGLMPDDGVVKVHPPIQRVFDETVEKLKAAGHEVVGWNNQLNAECIAVMDAYYTADGGEDIRKAVTAGGEPFLPHVQNLIDRAPAISVYQYWQLNRRKQRAQQAYHELWNSTKTASGSPVDVILTPTMSHTAVPHRKCRWVGYTKVFNLLDYPALSFPAGTAMKELDPLPGIEFSPRNDIDAWNWALYDPETMDGHPVGLQVVGRRFEEEKVLGVAAEVERVIRDS